MPVIRRYELIDERGKVIGVRSVSIDDIFKHISALNLIDAMNERAEFELWKTRKSLLDARSVPMFPACGAVLQTNTP